MSNNIWVFKLMTNEEVVAQVESRNEDGVWLSKPRGLHVVDMGNGQAGASFVAPLLLADDRHPVYVRNTAIMMESNNLNADYERRYLEAVSGISLATSLNG